MRSVGPAGQSSIPQGFEGRSMRIAVIIPARFGSSRFPGKPLAEIHGKSMIQRVYERSRQGSGVTEVAVATDSGRIARAVAAFGGEAIMTSASCRSGTDRVAEAAAKMGLADGDLVVNVQGDQPLLDPRCLAALLAPLVDGSGPAMSTLAFEIVRSEERTNPKDVKVVFNTGGDALYFSRSLIPLDRDGDQGHAVYKHLGVYAYTTAFLKRFALLPTGRLEGIEKLEQLRALEHGHAIRVVVTEYDSPEVDLPSDIGRLEARLSVSF
jgi:3-deoxy-manno-octulosonate cytidylyltransferase (CMP-KDO synthetase)